MNPHDMWEKRTVDALHDWHTVMMTEVGQKYEDDSSYKWLGFKSETKAKAE